MTAMLRVIRHQSGVVRLVDWVMLMLADSYPTTSVGVGDAAVECIAVDAVFVVYNVCSIAHDFCKTVTMLLCGLVGVWLTHWFCLVDMNRCCVAEQCQRWTLRHHNY